MASMALHMARPVACRMLSAAISSTEAKPTPQATALALISTSSVSRVLAESFLESSRPLGTFFGLRITATALTGPARGPRPASSTPQTRPPMKAFSNSMVGPFAISGLHRVMTEAAGQVIVDHADGLHPGVDDHRAHELEALGLQRLGDLFGQRRLGRNLADLGKVVLQGLAAGEAPAKLREILARVPHGEIDLGGLDSGVDLGVGADDAGVSHQPRPVDLAVTRHLLRIEVVEGRPEGPPLPQAGDPRKPRREA